MKPEFFTTYKPTSASKISATNKIFDINFEKAPYEDPEKLQAMWRHYTTRASSKEYTVHFFKNMKGGHMTFVH